MGSKNYFQVGWGVVWGQEKKFKWGGDPTPLEFLQELPTTNCIAYYYVGVPRYVVHLRLEDTYSG